MKERLLAFPTGPLDVKADAIVMSVPIVTPFFLVLFLHTFINFLSLNAIMMKYFASFKPN